LISIKAYNYTNCFNYHTSLVSSLHTNPVHRSLTQPIKWHFSAHFYYRSCEFVSVPRNMELSTKRVLVTNSNTLCGSQIFHELSARQRKWIRTAHPSSWIVRQIICRFQTWKAACTSSIHSAYTPLSFELAISCPIRLPTVTDYPLPGYFGEKKLKCI